MIDRPQTLNDLRPDAIRREILSDEDSSLLAALTCCIPIFKNPPHEASRLTQVGLTPVLNSLIERRPGHARYWAKRLIHKIAGLGRQKFGLAAEARGNYRIAEGSSLEMRQPPTFRPLQEHETVPSPMQS